MFSESEFYNMVWIQQEMSREMVDQRIENGSDIHLCARHSAGTPEPHNNCLQPHIRACNSRHA